MFCPWDILSLGRFFPVTFCPLGRFVPGTSCLGTLSPRDVLSWDVLSVGSFVLQRFVCAPPKGLSKFTECNWILKLRSTSGGHRLFTKQRSHFDSVSRFVFTPLHVFFRKEVKISEKRFVFVIYCTIWKNNVLKIKFFGNRARNYCLKKNCREITSNPWKSWVNSVRIMKKTQFFGKPFHLKFKIIRENLLKISFLTLRCQCRGAFCTLDHLGEIKNICENSLTYE